MATHRGGATGSWPEVARLSLGSPRYHEMVRKVITFLASASAGSMMKAKAPPQSSMFRLASPLLTLITKPAMYRTRAAQHERCTNFSGPHTLQSSARFGEWVPAAGARARVCCACGDGTWRDSDR